MVRGEFSKVFAEPGLRFPAGDFPQCLQLASRLNSGPRARGNVVIDHFALGHMSGMRSEIEQARLPVLAVVFIFGFFRLERCAVIEALACIEVVQHPHSRPVIGTVKRGRVNV